MEAKDITREYILKNFDIDNERQEITLKHSILFDLSMVDGLKINEVENYFKDLVKDSDYSNWVINIEAYYENVDTELIGEKKIKETDDEVVKRLMVREKQKIRKEKNKQNKKEKLKKQLVKIQKQLEKMED